MSEIDWLPESPQDVQIDEVQESGESKNFPAEGTKKFDLYPEGTKKFDLYP